MRRIGESTLGLCLARRLQFVDGGDDLGAALRHRDVEVLRSECAWPRTRQPVDPARLVRLRRCARLRYGPVPWSARAWFPSRCDGHRVRRSATRSAHVGGRHPVRRWRSSRRVGLGLRAHLGGLVGGKAQHAADAIAHALRSGGRYRRRRSTSLRRSSMSSRASSSCLARSRACAAAASRSAAVTRSSASNRSK